MVSKAGVWIDHQRAIVILITEAGQDIKKLTSGDEKPMLGSKRQKKEYTPNDFIAEDRRERKLVDERKKMYDGVLACIKGATSLVILGPGEAKGEFRKHIQTKKVRGLKIEVATADKMTDRQLAAKVNKHFADVSASKSEKPKKAAAISKANPPKKPTKKKTVTIAATKSRNKAGNKR